MNKPPERPLSPSALLVRLTWMAFLPVLAFFCAAATLHRPPLPLHVWDIVQIALISSIVAARYIDIVHFHGMTADNNEPATIGHWQRYALAMTGGIVVMQALAHLCSLLINNL